jgi:hypothetical protein
MDTDVDHLITPPSSPEEGSTNSIPTLSIPNSDFPKPNGDKRFIAKPNGLGILNYPIVLPLPKDVSHIFSIKKDLMKKSSIFSSIDATSLKLFKEMHNKPLLFPQRYLFQKGKRARAHLLYGQDRNIFK